MMRRAVAVALAVAALAVGSASQHGPNASTDGRVHTCGLVTEQGVTDHLDAYRARCATASPEGATRP